MQNVIYWTNKRRLRQRYREHIRHNESQSAYALHILNNKHEYGPISYTMTLLKHINKTSRTNTYPIIPPTQAAYFRTIHRWT